MLRGNLLPFITDYIAMVSKSLADSDASYRLTNIQKCWLGFCLAGIIMTNSICWEKFSRAGFGSWLGRSLSWMFRQSKINWKKLFHHSTKAILSKYV